VTATVTGAHGEAEQFIPVKFTVSSAGTPSASSGNAMTNALGKATFTYTNGTAGSDNVTVWADLDEDGVTDAGETKTVSVTWTAHPTTAAYTGPTLGTYHLAMTVSGKLTDDLTGSPIQGETLTIGFGTDTCTGVTNASGSASCTLTPQQVPGPYTATASYAGSTQYTATTSPGVAFTLNKRGTLLDITGPTNVANGFPATLKATLSEDMGGPGISGRTVSLTLGTGLFAQSCSGVTNASGQAQCTIGSVAQPAAATTVAVSASFAGDAYYLPSSDTATAKLLYYTGRAFAISGSSTTWYGVTRTRAYSDTGNISTSVASTKTASLFAANFGAVQSLGLSGSVTTGSGQSTASARVASARLAVPGLPLIVVNGVVTTSTSRCSIPAFTANASGGTTIVGLRIGGVARTITTAPNQVINLGVAKLFINQQLPVPGASAGLTVNGLRLVGLGQDIIVASATSDVHNCP